jgi:hypothetical protein
MHCMVVTLLPAAENSERPANVQRERTSKGRGRELNAATQVRHILQRLLCLQST